MFHTPDSLPRIKRAGGSGMVAYNVYTSTQTITIPKGATKAFVRMTGGGGASAGNPCGSGAGGCLETLLTGLKAGLTLSLTIGAAGSGVGGAPSSTLVSGSQTISTLTAGGGFAVNSGPGSGGSASGGDLNVSGNYGMTATDTTDSLTYGYGGANPFFGTSYGSGGGTGGSGGFETATPGVCVIIWYA